MSIETIHLQLLPLSREHLLTLIERPMQFEEKSGMRVADGFLDFYTSADVSPAWLAQLRASTAVDLWLHGFAVVDRQSHLIVGGAGFKGPPDGEGMVEIAYGIVPGYQGRGYATEAAAALVAFAFESGVVRIVRAHTLPAANASTRVLTKCGFTHTGEVVDPEDGLVWRWERGRKQPPPQPSPGVPGEGEIR